MVYHLTMFSYDLKLLGDKSNFLSVKFCSFIVAILDIVATTTIQVIVTYLVRLKFQPFKIKKREVLK
jgi:hypothetical protein